MTINELKKLKMEMIKTKQQNKRLAIESVLSEIELVESRNSKTLTDIEIDNVIKKCLSVFDEMAESWKLANRDNADFVDRSNFLKSLLPNQLSESELTMAIKDIVSTISNRSIKDMGKVMAELKNKYTSSVDMKLAAQIVKLELSR